MSTSSEAVLEQANALRLQGDLDGAAALCRRVLEAEPERARALSLLAACLAEQGDAAAARGPIEQARSLDPADPMVALHESVVLEQAEGVGAALAAAERASELGPDRFETWGRRGDLAGRAGRFDEAATALERAARLNPDHPGVALRLAGAKLEVGDRAGAAAALDLYERQAPETPDSLRIRVELLLHASDWRAMADRAEAWLAQEPGSTEARGALAYALGQLGYYDKASRIFGEVLAVEPDNAEHHAALGRLRLGARDMEEARACFDRALELDPECAEAAFGKARLLTFLGDLDAAAEMCRRTLAIDSGHLEAMGQLGEVSGGRLTDDELTHLEGLVADERIAADKRAIGLFALGDARRRRGEPAAAFDAWRQANALKASLVSPTRPGYDPAAQEVRRATIERLFPAPAPRSAAPDSARPTPIFIVGMPRSGTTLLEAAISAHSQVAPGGELPNLPYILDQVLDWAERTGWTGGAIPEAEAERWRDLYFRQYERFGVGDARFVTDKQPSNFESAGLIAALFPDAPILHIRRDPVETGFSIYRRNFSQQWPFADRLDHIAHYYGQYARMTAHWDAAMPGRVSFIQYEDLVDDFEPMLRGVLDAAGLGFEPQCLEYYKVERPVMTFSASQVRKPPSPEHKSSTGPYREQLGELIEALRERNIDLETGAWLDAPAPPAAILAPGARAMRTLREVF
ncbi:hypothetical protein DDZ18_12445 [Marinicauda salina]|uniref:Uncharacterized protein n=1 Tax=Marinicauda salina TaxID=2135793 RepID=A0A2U2BRD8_9PROT|nr:tetratricopeptide repeat-containing sulfotransferase family protein [Marinicauda salina]PWE16572.1 hypothetical protein DDZ18_12445 [Marinicauda salina]